MKAATIPAQENNEEGQEGTKRWEEVASFPAG